MPQQQYTSPTAHVVPSLATEPSESTAANAKSASAIAAAALDDNAYERQPFWDESTPVDVVYTWVNSTDPAWIEAANAAFVAAGLPPLSSMGASPANKFRDWHELLFSMRSLYTYAPWVRNFYIVTSMPSQVPAWLNTSHPRIRVVHHADLFDDPATQLPTFNSYAIETVLHRIPGLSNFFLYLNNDFLVGRPLARTDFWALPEEAPRMRYGAYIRYVDWAVNPSFACRYALFMAIEARSQGRKVELVDGEGKWPCRGETFGWDSLLAAAYFGELTSNWYVHAPHLWERRLMGAVERVLAAEVAVTRANRLRTLDTDVNIHVQYESHRTQLARDAAAGEPTVLFVQTSSKMAQDAALYKFYTLSDACVQDFYSLLDVVMLNVSRPLFIAVDDDLTAPTAAEIECHRQRLMMWFQRSWPNPAPWELPHFVPLQVDRLPLLPFPPRRQIT